MEEQAVYDVLRNVFDPEIPALSVLDLGMITGVSVHDDKVEVKMIPTYAACPATQYIKKLIADDLQKALPESKIEVLVDETIHWDTNRISELGKQRLKEHRIAPPATTAGTVTKEMMIGINCPECNGTNTFLQIPFGYTLCRAIHFCKDCNKSFEQFKPVAL